MLRRGAHTAWRTVGGETVVIDLDAKVMYGLDEPGAAVWEALDDHADAGALAAAVDLEPAAVGRFLAALADAGLTEPATGGPAADDDAAEATAGEEAGDAGPRILWHEALPRVAATCAFVPGQNQLCDQVPFN